MDTGISITKMVQYRTYRCSRQLLTVFIGLILYRIQSSMLPASRSGRGIVCCETAETNLHIVDIPGILLYMREVGAYRKIWLNHDDELPVHY